MEEGRIPDHAITASSSYEAKSVGPQNASSMPESALNFSFVGCLIFQVLMYCGHAHEYIMLDGLKINILVQLRMHFQYLRLNVEDILAYHPSELERGEAWNVFQKRLKELVTYHCSLTTLVEMVEDVFNKCVLFSFLTLSVFSCFSLYSMSSIALFGLQFWKFAGFILFPCILFFVDCYFSEEVLTESAELSNSCYNVEFNGADVRFQKALLMLMRRSQKRLMFTIGQFAPLSILTTVTIMKAAVSYFMLLRNMKNH
ncbi:odorant receptor 67a-like [Photinus pyralis]|uniref:odorant receptor 67a-like n=1 Tax=Photinus pyralis TaxID=7054 RepID=UPI0012671799|nr:odorant receptor 67a-like [Photinus pyralis]